MLRAFSQPLRVVSRGVFLISELKAMLWTRMSMWGYGSSFLTRPAME